MSARVLLKGFGGLPRDRCRSCGAAIVWTTTANEKTMPVDAPEDDAAQRVVLVLDTSEARPRVLSRIAATTVSHFSTCPNAAKHRKDRKS